MSQAQREISVQPIQCTTLFAVAPGLDVGTPYLYSLGPVLLPRPGLLEGGLWNNWSRSSTGEWPRAQAALPPSRGARFNMANQAVGRLHFKTREQGRGAAMRDPGVISVHGGWEPSISKWERLGLAGPWLGGNPLFIRMAGAWDKHNKQS